MRKKRYTRRDDQAIIEAFEPKAARIERTARELGRTRVAIARRYYLPAPRATSRQYHGLARQRGPDDVTTYELATLASTVAIDLGRIAIVWYGIRELNRATDKCSHDRRQHAQALDQRHDETMLALRELVARTAAGD